MAKALLNCYADRGDNPDDQSSSEETMVTQKSQTNPSISLSVSAFSALKEVKIDFKPLTILTGPQASGKSLLCKLIYFFQDFDEEMVRAISDRSTFPDFRRQLSQRFVEWFPPSAWGAGNFEIIYKTEKFSIEAHKVRTRSRGKSDVSINFSANLEEFYVEALDFYIKSAEKVGQPDDLTFIRSEYNWRAQRSFYKLLNERFIGALTAGQVYVPASRAFFTTFGKTMSAFEHGQLLDPITKSFGRLYVLLIDRMRHSFPMSIEFDRKGNLSGSRYRHKALADVFGGKPKIERNEMVIESDDGRVIPLFALSSGQQEMLPLWIALDYFESTIRYASDINGPNVLYIEEPEAHLFPEAQTVIVDVLSSLLRTPKSSSQMVLTTHSPYILAKANNLMLAGRMGFRRRKSKQQQVAKIVPKNRWLLRQDVACYGLSGGRAVDIIGEDGLISTDYIDSVSQDVIEEFSALMDIE